MSGNKVAKNSSYYMLASFLPKMVGLVLLPFYSRYLTPDDYGVVAIVQSMGVYFPLLLSLQLYSSIGRFYFHYEGEQLRTYLSSIFWSLLVISALFVPVLYYFMDDIVAWAFPNTPSSYYWLFKISLFTAFFNIYQTAQAFIIRAREKARIFMLISMCSFVFTVLLTIYYVIIEGSGASGVIMATMYGTALTSVAFFFVNVGHFNFKFDFSLMKDPIKYSIPLIPHAISGYVFMYSDRIILEKYPEVVSLAAIGLYSFADRIAFVFKTVVNQFNEAFLPHFMKTSKEDKALAISDNRQASSMMIYLVSIAIAALALYSREIMYFMFDERYFDAWLMLSLLSSAFVFRAIYNFTVVGVFYEKQTKWIALVTISAGVLNVVLNLLFIHLMGVYIAIFSTIASFMLTAVLAIAISKRHYYVGLNYKLALFSILYMYSCIALVYFYYGLNSAFEFSWIDFIVKLFILFTGGVMGVWLKILNLATLKKFLKRK